IARLDVPDRSLLDVGSGGAELAAALATMGWRVRATAASEHDAAVARSTGIEVAVADAASLPRDARYGVVSLFHVIEHTSDLSRTMSELDHLVMPGGFLVLEYPNGRSFLKACLGWRWFGYDPPFHRLQVNPTVLADRLGLENYRLLEEDHFSLEYSFFVFAQSVVNLLMPFQRDALYRWLCGRSGNAFERACAVLSMPLFALLLPLFLIYQPLVGLLHRGCIVRQVFRKTDIGAARDRPDAREGDTPDGEPATRPA
ncbi:MAG: methyltransferase domain-containing protein, partial [Thermodesulfobacteriota bacterium]